MFDPGSDGDGASQLVLGIDPGVSRCGYGVVRRDAGRFEAVAYGVIRTPPSDELPTRLATLLRELRPLLHLDALTVTGRTLGEELDAAPPPFAQDVVRPLAHPIHPQGSVAVLWGNLAPGGAIYVRVPNYGSLNRRMLGAKWCGFRYPDHVNYFTTTSLGAMAGDCGLKLKLLNPIRHPLDDNINAVLSSEAACG